MNASTDEILIKLAEVYRNSHPTGVFISFTQKFSCSQLGTAAVPVRQCFVEEAGTRFLSQAAGGTGVMSHIMVWRDFGGTRGQEDGLGGFYHHGILCGGRVGPDGLLSGDATVIHYAGMDGVKSLRNARIMRTHHSEFQGDGRRKVHVVAYRAREHKVVYGTEEVVQRAESRLGHARYDLLFDNCESFARWCVVGDEKSLQSQGALVGVAAGVASLVFGGGLLGAALTAVVTQKYWDRKGNRSASRRGFDSDDDEPGGASPSGSGSA